jgi:hypothetical protein
MIKVNYNHHHQNSAATCHNFSEGKNGETMLGKDSFFELDAIQQRVFLTKNFSVSSSLKQKLNKNKTSPIWKIQNAFHSNLLKLYHQMKGILVLT